VDPLTVSSLPVHVIASLWGVCVVGARAIGDVSLEKTLTATNVLNKLSVAVLVLHLFIKQLAPPRLPLNFRRARMSSAAPTTRSAALDVADKNKYALKHKLIAMDRHGSCEHSPSCALTVKITTTTSTRLMLLLYQ